MELICDFPHHGFSQLFGLQTFWYLINDTKHNTKLYYGYFSVNYFPKRHEKNSEWIGSQIISQVGSWIRPWVGFDFGFIF